MSHLHSSSRRSFLQSTAAALPIVLGALPVGRSTISSVAGAAASVGEGNRRLRAAVIGATGRGDYGHGLELIFQQRENVDLVGLADRDEAGRKRAAAKIGAPRSYADYAEMLEKEKPELVSIAMRHSDQHHEIAMRCLRVGAHLYMEKPITRAPVEADELLAEAERRGRRIGVAHTMRVSQPVQALFEAIRAGRIGELVEMRAYGKQDARAGGEDMMVLGSHLFDLMRKFAGDPAECSARVRSKGREIVPADRRLVKDNVGWVAGDEVFARFGFSNGVNATFTSHARLRSTVGHWGIEFHGSEGIARLNCDLTPNVFVRTKAEWTPLGRSDGWTPLAPQVKADGETNHGLRFKTDPVADWLDAVRDGREPECSGRNGAWAVEMVMAIYESSLTRKTVSFPLTRRTHPLEG